MLCSSACEKGHSWNTIRQKSTSHRGWDEKLRARCFLLILLLLLNSCLSCQSGVWKEAALDYQRPRALTEPLVPSRGLTGTAGRPTEAFQQAASQAFATSEPNSRRSSWQKQQSAAVGRGKQTWPPHALLATSEKATEEPLSLPPSEALWRFGSFAVWNRHATQPSDRHHILICHAADPPLHWPETTNYSCLVTGEELLWFRLF